MHKFWGWLGLNLGKHWITVLAVGAVLTVGLGFGITQLEFATGQDSYLNKSDQVYKDSVAYQKLFGGQAMLTLVTMDEGHTVNELFTPENIAQWKSIEKKLNARADVVNIVTPLTALEFNDALVTGPDGDPTQGVAGKVLLAAISRETDPEAKAARTEDAAKTLERISAIPVAERTLDNPEYVEFLLHDNQGNIRKPLLANFPDERHAQIVTRLPGQRVDRGRGQGRGVRPGRGEAAEVRQRDDVTTGAPMLLKNLNDYLTGGMLTLGAIAVAIMALILLVLFSVRWRLLALGVVMIGVIWAFGIAGYLGIPLTIVTIGGLPVMLGIGIDYAIQMHARVEEEVVIDRADHPIQETARNLGPALLVVTFDAIFAFAALRFAKVPMIRQFGLLLAVGVATICINSIVGTARDPRHPRVQVARPRRKDFRAGPLGRLVVWLGGIPAKAAVGLAIASVVIFAGGHHHRGQARAADRPDPVGQPGLAGHQGPRTSSTRRRARRASSACSCSRTTTSTTRPSASWTSSRGSSWRSTRRRCSPARASSRSSAT